jgi:hypothetical protein
MMELKPESIARRSTSRSVPWSRLKQTGTLAPAAALSGGGRQAILQQGGLHAHLAHLHDDGERSSSAASITAIRLSMLKYWRPAPCNRAGRRPASISFSVTNMKHSFCVRVFRRIRVHGANRPPASGAPSIRRGCRGTRRYSSSFTLATVFSAVMP